ncbi:hypothetical protein HDU67_003236 [Dinochytrium kinnereticum]|nr:hypothetical protein HDU67_003236 [Dinochytrium kinnereticum]
MYFRIHQPEHAPVTSKSFTCRRHAEAEMPTTDDGCPSVDVVTHASHNLASVSGIESLKFRSVHDREITTVHQATHRQPRVQEADNVNPLPSRSGSVESTGLAGAGRARDQNQRHPPYGSYHDGLSDGQDNGDIGDESEMVDGNANVDSWDTQPYKLLIRQQPARCRASGVASEKRSRRPLDPSLMLQLARVKPDGNMETRLATLGNISHMICHVSLLTEEGSKANLFIKIPDQAPESQNISRRLSSTTASSKLQDRAFFAASIDGRKELSDASYSLSKKQWERRRGEGRWENWADRLQDREAHHSYTQPDFPPGNRESGGGSESQPPTSTHSKPQKAAYPSK